MCILPHCICSLSITQLNICVHIYACVHIVLYFIGICSQHILQLICSMVKCLYESSKIAHLRNSASSSIIPNMLLCVYCFFLYYPTLYMLHMCCVSLKKMFYQLHTICILYCLYSLRCRNYHLLFLFKGSS